MMRDKTAAAGLALLLALVTAGGAGAREAEVRIGYLQADIHQLACLVALKKGFYKEQGLDVRVAGVFKAGPEEMSAFAAGELDMGYVGQAPATTAVANGAARVRVLAQVNTEGSALIVAGDSSIRKAEDLAGKTIAVPGHSTVQDFLVRRLLMETGLPAGRVKTVVIKPPEMISALRTGQVDAFIAWEPYPAKARSMGVGRMLVSSARIWPEHPCCVLAADEEFLRSRPEEARDMVAAHVRATDFINQNPGEALEIGVEFTGMDRATVRMAMDNVNYTYRISVEGAEEYASLLAEQGYIKIKDVEGFLDRFLDHEPLKAVLAR